MKLDITAPLENLHRAVQISLVGNHPLFIGHSTDVDDHCRFYPFEVEQHLLESYPVIRIAKRIKSADIAIELANPTLDMYLSSKFNLKHAKETIERLRSLVVLAVDRVNPTPTKQAMELLQLAYDRLGLKVSDVNRVLSVALTIALIDYVDNTTIEPKILPRHIAEAINYITPKYDSNASKSISQTEG